jgi:hypothetical protein
MTGQSAQSIFNRVDPEVLRRPEPTKESKPSKPANDARKRSRKRPRWKWRRTARFLAPIVWVTILVNTVVVNLEAILVRNFPQYASVLQYRLLFVTAALVVSVTFWRSRSFYKSVLYVVFYPFVLVGWVIPRFLWGHRSWSAGIGLVHVIFGLVGGFRRGVYLWALLVLDVALLITATSWTAVGSLILSALLLGWTILSMLVQALKPDRFLRIQAKMFRWWTSDEERFQIPEELRKPFGPKLDEKQSNLVADRAATASMTIYVGRFWADRIESYTRGKAFVVFGALAVLRYFGLFLVFIAIANAALYQVDGDQFVVSESPSWIAWAQYSMASMASGDVFGVTAVGDGARLIATIAAMLGILVVPILGVSLWQGHKYSTTNGSSDGPMDAIKKDCDRVENMVREAFKLPVHEVAKQLMAWNNMLFGLLVTLSRFTDYDFGFPKNESTAAPSWATVRDRPRSHRGRRGRSRSRREGK